jgi:predicted dehydrogenase
MAGPLILPSYVVGARGQTPPSSRINLACIGCGNQGWEDLNELATDPGVNIVALCDADARCAAPAFERFPNARRFRDFRAMFDAAANDIDAVLVATPDHTHAAATLAAIQNDKHVYCEKPLAHSLWETRLLLDAAIEHPRVVTQLGNQGHSLGTIRDFCEWIQDGAIGDVHTIDLGSPGQNSYIDDLPSLEEPFDAPDELDWDLWLGPVPFRPYHPLYCPGRWRGWTAFGNGTIGDWMCHVADPVFWALNLGAPTTIQAEVEDWDYETQGETFPKGEIVTFEFPANDKRGAVTLRWHGGNKPIPRPPELDPDDKFNTTGAVVRGDKGAIVYGSHGAWGFRLIPDSRNDAYARPPKTMPRVNEHHREWLDAIREGRKADADFSYGAPLSDLAMLGIIAIKLAGTQLEWDAQKREFSNALANELIKPEFRPGWGM